MAESQGNAESRGGFRAWLHRTLLRPSARFSALALLAAGAATGVLLLAGFDAALQATSTDSFCGTCHANDASKEWRVSAHARNRAGFVAGCSDCHVPREFVPKMARKVKAVREVWGHFTGVIDTPEKYEAHRGAMAQGEWDRMRGNGAKECRNCHHPDAMASKDKAHVAAMHQGALAGGAICIDCHQGVAHRAPGQAPAPGSQK